MGQALEMCVHCENKLGCHDCADLHNWIMEHQNPVKQGWISTKDRLPTKKDANKNESVLAVAKKDGFGRSWCWDIVRDYSSEFSHWMPFPKFPWKEN